jgi:hypothetical protein
VVGVGNTRYHKHCFLCPLCKTDLTNSPFHLENGASFLSFERSLGVSPRPDLFLCRPAAM